MSIPEYTKLTVDQWKCDNPAIIPKRAKVVGQKKSYFHLRSMFRAVTLSMVLMFVAVTALLVSNILLWSQISEMQSQMISLNMKMLAQKADFGQYRTFADMKYDRLLRHGEKKFQHDGSGVLQERATETVPKKYSHDRIRRSLLKDTAAESDITMHESPLLRRVRRRSSSKSKRGRKRCKCPGRKPTYKQNVLDIPPAPPKATAFHATLKYGNPDRPADGFQVAAGTGGLIQSWKLDFNQGFDVYYQDSRNTTMLEIQVKKTGVYYLYSQVTFKLNNYNGPYISKIKIGISGRSDFSGCFDEPRETRSPVSADDYITSSPHGIAKLEKGWKIEIWIPPELKVFNLPISTYFGAYLIGDVVE